MEERGWWIYEFLVQQITDSKEKEKIYRAGLEKFPQSHQLIGNYAIFLKNIRKDYDGAESYYKRALELDSESAIKNGNYANFLKNIRKDYDKAERYYKQALELDPGKCQYKWQLCNFSE